MAKQKHSVSASREGARPSPVVRKLALWTILNVDAGASSPFIMGLALGTEPLPISEPESDHAEWLWWLERSATETAFLAALLEREGIEIELTRVAAADDGAVEHADRPGLRMPRYNERPCLRI